MTREVSQRCRRASRYRWRNLWFEAGAWDRDVALLHNGGGRDVIETESEYSRSRIVPNTCLKLHHCLSPTCAFALSATTPSCTLHVFFFFFFVQGRAGLFLQYNLYFHDGLHDHRWQPSHNVTTRAHAVVQSLASFLSFSFCLEHLLPLTEPSGYVHLSLYILCEHTCRRNRITTPINIALANLHTKRA